MPADGLFVDEEDYDSIRVKEEDGGMAMEIDVIPEEDEEKPSLAHDDGDDPVINTIPVHLAPIKEGSYHIIQFPGRPKARGMSPGVKPSIKPESKYLQVKVPLDTSKFFNVNKTEAWGDSIGEQTLEGVLDECPGLYVCRVVDNKVVMTPVHSSAQMRPTFHYVDAVDAAALAAARKENETPAKQQTTSQVLQSAAKVNTQNLNADGYNGSLGEALRYVKIFDEEEWTGLAWKQSAPDTMPDSREAKILVPTTTRDEYIDRVTDQLVG
ncbi:DNA-directed RNA polymerase III subunit RPC5 [Diutina catenulata]